MVPDQTRDDVRRAIASGRAVLVTGAGFSCGAYDLTGQHLPTGTTMAQEIWPAAFPDEPFEPNSRLGEIFDVALRNNPASLREYLHYAMSVDRDALPGRYIDWFNAPWYRIYTLNIDDLDEAVQEATPAPRAYHSLSAMSSTPGDMGRTRLPHVIHLHGRAPEFPHLTFSPISYGNRTAHPDLWYQQFVADILIHPVVFVGTQLDESFLWHYLEARGKHGPRADQRPRSYLVTPNLPRSRQALLAEFNTELVPLTEEDFHSYILRGEVEAMNASALRGTHTPQADAAVSVQKAIENAGRGSSDFLFGFEPEWEDITDGYAVERDVETSLLAVVEKSLPVSIVLHGTAGAGVSTTLRRIAVLLNAAGKRVYWLDRETRLNIGDLRTLFSDLDPDVVVIDGIDRFGSSARALLIGIAKDSDCATIGGLRSPRLHLVEGAGIIKIDQSDLSPTDADRLVSSLERANRLGELRALGSHELRVERLLKQSSSILLVAMMQATSGKPFDDKIEEELNELGGIDRTAYSLMCLAAHLDEQLTREDILLALQGYNGNDVLQSLAILRSARLVRTHHDALTVRHRLIGDVAVRAMRRRGSLVEPVANLLWLAGLKSQRNAGVRDRYGRLLVRLLNHDLLADLLSTPEHVRSAYSQLDRLLSDEFHFWLQRAEYEIAHEQFSLARNFLAQAEHLKEQDIFIETAWGHLLLKEACNSPTAADSRTTADEGLRRLEAALAGRPKFSPHTYGVYGRLGLAWLRRGALDAAEARDLAKRLLAHTRIGSLQYPRNDVLSTVLPDIERKAKQLGVG